MHHDLWTCDRACRDGRVPREAPFHIDLKIGEEVLDPGKETEHVAIQYRRVDLCKACTARALDYLTDGMGYAQAQAFLAFASAPAEAVTQKEPV
jgi:hypothetical protein